MQSNGIYPLSRIVLTLPLMVLTTLSASCATIGLQETPYGQYVQYAQHVQTAAPGQPQRTYAQPELDQMLAPVALYPDALLAQILMAATYPHEVIEAAYWSQANPGLSGEQAVLAVQQANWDSSVRSLVAFPQILQIMRENPRWLDSLGEAFMTQQAEVMNTIQSLRRRAMAQGSLRSNDEIHVYPQGQTLIIQSVHSEIVYVPYYDPNVVYGPWWWSGYPPVYWQPWPGYHSRPGYAPGYAWSSGIIVGSGFFFGIFDWDRRRVSTAPVEHGVRNNHRMPLAAPDIWQHDRAHRVESPPSQYRRDQRDYRDYREQAPHQQFIRPAPPQLPQQMIVRPTPTRVIPVPESSHTIAMPPAPGTRRDHHGNDESGARPEGRHRLQPGLGPAIRPDASNTSQPPAQPVRAAPTVAPAAPQAPAAPGIGAPAKVEQVHPGNKTRDSAPDAGAAKSWRGRSQERGSEGAAERPMEKTQERADRVRPFQP